MTYKVHLESDLPKTPDQQVIVEADNFTVENDGRISYLLFYKINKPVAFFRADDVNYVEIK